ncbi:uncharacterized protein TDEL_0C05990 [Torulaspora delbrueckii]|uniref:Peptidyl-prolyl cis-trans isomerase n=1 Tax=Torulaspora delbrueckii TaxID=4950 RepID=G8ZSJ6_TORDE|nr:hypothetical protein TDEL_0C05990 [Torulaspora delbrueckii]CCE91488.1 hypothetical protein TDEL_0C05990 [Torulaspora delbrueckii]
MSVLIETTIGDVVVELDCKSFQIESYNFLKLCKSNVYQYQCLYNIHKDRLVEFGNPLVGFEDRKELRVHNTSIEGVLRSHHLDEIRPELIKTTKDPADQDNGFLQVRKGRLGMKISRQPNGSLTLIGSQALLTLNDDREEFQDIIFFGTVLQDSIKTLDFINAMAVDSTRRPLVDVRIRKMHVIHDPFPDPPNLHTLNITVPSKDVRLPEDVIKTFHLDPEKQEIHSYIRRKELSLEIMGDVPGVGIKPSERVLFICRLNPSTKAKDIATIFHRFGEVHSVEIVRDKESGRSLCYGFIEFNDRKACESAYKNMNGVLIDDKRIKVDFSQSLSRNQRR